MENIKNSSPFLNAWHDAMFYGAIVMGLVALGIFLFHHFKTFSLKSPKEKYDWMSKREIRNLELVFIFLAVGVAMIINRYGMDKIEEVTVFFFVRLFVSVAGGTMVGYIAFLILEYYYPSRLDDKLKKWRYMPRVNPKTGNKMRLLAEHEEDVHMDAGMKAEEDVFSIDYDVWMDEKTQDIMIEKYQGHLQAVKCGNCGFYTLKVVREEITQQPTLTTQGELIKHYECSYCKSVRATAFKISTMEGDDYKKESHVFNKDVVLVKVEIRSASGGSKYYEFGDLVQAQKFLTEIDEE
jgi:hypothetical protein